MEYIPSLLLLLTPKIFDQTIVFIRFMISFLVFSSDTKRGSCLRRNELYRHFPASLFHDKMHAIATSHVSIETTT